MSSVQYDELQPAGAATNPLRLLIGAVAILLLVALAAFGADVLPRDAASVETDDGAGAVDHRSVSAPVYDGRGKWRGY